MTMSGFSRVSGLSRRTKLRAAPTQWLARATQSLVLPGACDGPITFVITKTSATWAIIARSMQRIGLNLCQSREDHGHEESDFFIRAFAGSRFALPCPVII